MWRISPGGAEAWLAAHGRAAELRATSPAVKEVLVWKVKAPFGQQTQSKHSVLHPIDGSSHPTGQAPEMPDTAALKPTSTRMAASANADRFTRGSYITAPQKSKDRRRCGLEYPSDFRPPVDRGDRGSPELNVQSVTHSMPQERPLARA